MEILKFFLPGLRENWKVVLLSVLGAATFWFFNAMNKSYDTRLEYPLSYVFERDSVVIVKPLRDKIKIDVTSGGWNLIRKTLRINAEPVKITLENPTEIKYLTRSTLIPIIKEQLSGLELTYVVTDTLYFDIEEKASKKLPLIVDSLTIPLKNNYRIVSPVRLSQDSVRITGPKSMIAELNTNVEIAFPDEEIDGDFEAEELGYRLDKLIKASPRKAEVSFRVNRFILKEMDIPVEYLNLPSDSSVVADQNNIRVYFTINEELEDDVSKSDFSIIADYTMLNQRDSTLSPILMYAHDKALDIVLNVDKLHLNFNN